MQIKLFKKILLAGFLVSVMLLFPINSAYSNIGIQIEHSTRTFLYRGNTLYVGGSGSGNYSKIQDAIDDAVDGDTVFVYDDSAPYWESIVIDKSIKLIGENRDTTVIIGNDSICSVVKISSLTSNIFVSGFTIMNGSNEIRYDSNYNKIYKNNIYNNKKGIEIYDCNNCTIENIDSSGLDIGILIIGSSHGNLIRNCTIKDNTYAGIMIEAYNYDCCNNNISNNIINDNFRGIYFVEIYANSVYGNIIKNNVIGIQAGPSVHPDEHEYQSLSINYEYGDICSNTITNNVYGVFLDYCEFINVFQNNITKNNVGIYHEDWLSSGYNNIYQNNFINNGKGIYIRGYNGGASDNNIYENNIMYNSEGIFIFVGDLIEGASDNKIYHNNFIKNGYNARNWGDNIWDDNSEGNYWDNYKGKDKDDDGIGDSPYWIRPYFILNKDRYPLMEPYGDVPDVSINQVNEATQNQELIKQSSNNSVTQSIFVYTNILKLLLQRLTIL